MKCEFLALFIYVILDKMKHISDYTFNLLKIDITHFYTFRERYKTLEVLDALKKQIL